jgi:hypothetical protein
MKDPEVPDRTKGDEGGRNESRHGKADPNDRQAAESAKGADPPETKAEWNERHGFYLDDATARISRAKTALLLWVAALLTTWLSGIEQSRHDVEEFVTTMAAHDRSTNEALEPERRQKALTPREQPPLERDVVDAKTGTGNGDPNVTSKELRTGPDKDRSDLQKKATQAVNFGLFGAKMPIPPLVAPSVWLALLCGMFLKLLSDRWWVFRSLGRALRIEREHLALPGQERIADAPWWLAPIPIRTSSRHVSREDLQAALDWKARPLRRFFLSGASLAVLAAVITAVFYANLQLLKYAPDLERFTGHTFRAWQIQLASWSPMLLVPAWVMLICKWATPLEIPVSFSHESTPRRNVKRDLLFMGLWLVVGGSFFLFLNRKTAIIQTARRETQRFGRDCTRLMAKLARIRDRRLTQVPGVEPVSAYKNPRSPVVHVSNLAGAFRFPKIPRQHVKVEHATITAVLGKNKRTTRVVLPAASWAFELKAIEAVEQKNPRLACDLLLCAVRHDLLFLKSEPRRPSYRLYDLLAGLSVRFGTAHLSALGNLLKNSPASPAFRYRLAAWDNADSRWRKRWTAADRVWITSIARPKKTKTELKDFRADSEKKRLRIPMKDAA